MSVFSFGSNSTISPAFIMLSTFLLCGGVIGCFSAGFVPDLSELGATIIAPQNNFLSCFFDAIKYNLLVILCIKHLGFLVPIIVSLRGFLLSFSVSTIYANSDVLAGSSIFFESILNSFVTVPCFLIISTICLKLFVIKKSLNSRKSRKKARIEGSYFAIFALLTLNFLWNLICAYIF